MRQCIDFIAKNCKEPNHRTQAALCISYNKLYPARSRADASRWNRSAAGESSILESMSSGSRDRAGLRPEPR
jgi:hypothetical protein